MFAQCHGPLWRYDDFTRCFLRDYLQTLLPLIACGVSLLFLLYQILRVTIRTQQASRAYTALEDQRQGGEEESSDNERVEDALAYNEELVLQLSLIHI